MGKTTTKRLQFRSAEDTSSDLAALGHLLLEEKALRAGGHMGAPLPARSVAALAQASYPSTRRKRQVSLIPLRLLFPPNPLALGFGGGPLSAQTRPLPLCTKLREGP